MKLKLDTGREMLSNISDQEKEHVAYLFSQNLADVIEILVTGDPTQYSKYEQLEKERLNKIREKPDSDPFKLFGLAEIKLQWAFVKMRFGDELNAGWNILSVNKLIEENRSRFPDFLLNNKTYGTVQIIVGSIPSKYRWILGLFGLKGSVPEGLTTLSKLQEHQNIFQLEASLIANMVAVHLLQEDESKNFEKIFRDHPDNLLVKYFYSAILMKHAQSEKALTSLRQAETLQKGYLDFYFLDYLRAEIHLQSGNYDQALLHYNQFIERYQGNNYIKAAYFKIFLCHWLNHEDQLALDKFDLAKEKGEIISDADKYANKLLKRNEYPNRLLMKLRLATDGGYFAKAIQLMHEGEAGKFNNPKDQVEFIYRKARLFHKQNQQDVAIELYKKTIQDSENSPWYFAPNACLQLGHIYKSKDHRGLAIFYFQKALDYNDHEYKSSIDHKAKSALEELK
ncbi:hypothetical protein QQ008_03490 [Fulvivirgaceae bacterium BMA10]|uniref:Tetratricopeptide repeat protein n=1 Tax=Splendidivirga corallicola TaxID=3051826 RepID=A0ABT8KI59_9BACT|nr:hypothetical protein [Fulvivirgaceae bacterium BMA10]